MKQKLKNVFSFVLRFGVSGLLLWYIFTKIDIQKTQEVLKSADLSYLFYAGIVFLVINFILLWRWFIFIKALDLSVSIMTVIRYYFAGLFGNLFLPSSIGGDIIKIIGLCRGNRKKAKVVASVLLDRLSGFVAIVLVASASFIFGYGFIEDKSSLFFILCMALLFGMISVVLFNQRLYRFCCQIFNRIPRVKEGLMLIHDDIMLLKGRRKEAFQGVVLSCLSQAVFSLTYYLTARALHQDIQLIYFFIFVPLICMASAFPSIGGLGIREAGAAYLFLKVGVDAGIAVSFSLINFLFMVIFGLLGGLFYVSTLSFGRVQYYPSDAEVFPTKA